MLTLTRRIGETVSIGADIKVVVLGVNGRQCRIGIDAPKDVTVLREEVVSKVRRERPPSG
jgi:carbon storage regulator